MEENNPANDLVYFLSQKSLADNIKLTASEYLLGLTGSEEGRNFIVQNIGANKFADLIVDLMAEKSSDLQLQAHKCLVNLSAEHTTYNMIASDKTLTTLFEKIINNSSTEKSREISEKVSMSLSNLAHWKEGAIKIMNFLMKNDNSMVLYKLIEIFFNNCASLHHLASFFSNLTQQKEARKLFLDKEKLIFQKLLAFVSFKESKIRQHGIVATVKNCCFEIDDHLWLLGEQVDILPRLLLPLAGPEVFDDEDTEKLPIELQYLEDTKERESDPTIRKILIEAISQLCTTQAGRKIVKDANTYIILRELHKWEKDEACIEVLENLISILISEEPEKGLEDLSKVVIPEHIQLNFSR
ncbi:hypothetical protein HELRODRAFT_82006 [Helobdella robusta]|uniref:Protein HGH1 homolog n=1 Tax=Helobdella robusta TaxID=6412 RepID=T1G4L7_HELRO|nr:hypothetical protein HELRODRAFT_82006 [Helobdella robusta]ESO01458.1 hypothetical protein HELRODRAFT_82006 [Helobdella robusta]